MEPVRILHIIHTLSRGGMESRIMDLYRNLDKARYQFDFYAESGRRGMYDSEVEELGGTVYYAEIADKYNIPDFNYFYRFLKKHEEYKIVYAYNQWAGFYLKKAKKCGVPHRIAYARTSIQTKSMKNTIKNLVKRNINKYATHKFAVSKKAAVWLFGENRTNGGDVNIWPNAIDTEKFAFSDCVRRDIRCELGLTDEFTVIHVGNIRYEKNHSYLLEVFSQIKRTYKNAKLILVGGGNIERLIPKMQALGIRDSVIYLGVRQDIPRLLHAGDLFLFPSLYEGFPGAVLEAEACGLNCLISDSITDEVLLTDHILSLSLSDGPGRWAEAVKEFCIPDRAEAWKEIRKAGYDIHALTDRTQRFYETLIAPVGSQKVRQRQ